MIEQPRQTESPLQQSAFDDLVDAMVALQHSPLRAPDRFRFWQSFESLATQAFRLLTTQKIVETLCKLGNPAQCLEDEEKLLSRLVFDSERPESSRCNYSLLTSGFNVLEEKLRAELETDDDARQKAALQFTHSLIEQIESSFEVFAADIMERGEREPFNFEKLKRGALHHGTLTLELPNGNTFPGTRLLSMLSDVMAHAAFREELEKICITADHSCLERDRLEYGAKGARLLQLVRAEEALRPLLEKVRLDFQVPPFQLFTRNVFLDWRGRVGECPEVIALYKWLDGREALLRSSVVHSEDGAAMGAGIYKTLRLAPGTAFDTFCKAIDVLHNSVDTLEAQKYRAEYGIREREIMCGILHIYTNEDDCEPAGYLNTVRANMPSVCDVTRQDRMIPVFREGGEVEIDDCSATVQVFSRECLKRRLYDIDSLQGCSSLLQADHTNSYSQLYVDTAERLSAIGLILEEYIREPLQIEFIAHGFTVSLVQQRPLPPTWAAEKVALFPDREDYIWQGSSVGVMDEELDILSPGENNENRKGVAIFVSTVLGSENLMEISKAIPREGAVWLLTPSGFMRGHVESRSIQRGITIITGDSERPDVFHQRLWDAYGQDLSNRMGRFFILEPRGNFRRLRIVSTGLEARIYVVDSQNP